MSVGGLQPTRRTVLVVSSGDKHYIFLQIVYEYKCQGQLAGWLANLTLEDEVRLDLDLRRVVCEYVDVFFFQMSYLDYLHRGL